MNAIRLPSAPRTALSLAAGIVLYKISNPRENLSQYVISAPYPDALFKIHILFLLIFVTAVILLHLWALWNAWSGPRERVRWRGSRARELGAQVRSGSSRARVTQAREQGRLSKELVQGVEKIIPDVHQVSGNDPAMKDGLEQGGLPEIVEKNDPARNRDEDRPSRTLLQTIRNERWLHFLITIFTGFALPWMEEVKEEDKLRELSWANWVDGEMVILDGKVLEKTESEYGTALVLQTEKVCLPSGRRFWNRATLQAGHSEEPYCLPLSHSFNTRLRWMAGGGRSPGDTHFPNDTHTQARSSTRNGIPLPLHGDDISVLTELKIIRASKNPGVFDRQEWLLRAGVRLEGDAVELYALHPRANLFEKMRARWEKRLDDIYSKENAAFLQAFLIGSRQGMTTEMRESFSRSGLSHIMSVSGLHVGLLMAPFLFLIPLAGRRPFTRVVAWIAMATILFAYAGLTGFRVSVNRASLMMFLLVAGRLNRYKSNAVNTMSASAVILLLWDPEVLFDAGFQLSYGAVLILLLWMGAIQSWFQERIDHKWLRTAIMILLTSIVIQLGMLPLLSFWFGQVSLISPLANLLVIPLLPWLLPSAFFHLLFSDFIPLDWLASSISRGVEWVRYVADSASEQEASVLNIGKMPIAAAGVWMVILSALLPKLPRMKRWKRFGTGLILMTLLGVLQTTRDLKGDPLEVVYLDVGQGDATVLHTPDGQTYLIDAGHWSQNVDSGKDVLIPYFTYREVSHLQGLILTHPHADHIGGALTLLEQMRVDTIYVPETKHHTALAAKLDSLIDSKRIPKRVLQAGDLLLMGNKMRAMVLNPWHSQGKPHSDIASAPETDAKGPPLNLMPHRENQVESEVNNQSIVLRLVYGETSFLFMGDAEKSVETELMRAFPEQLESEVLKVGHHGSRTSSTADFLSMVNPDIAVVQVAYVNRYGLPNSDVTKRFSSKGIAVYYTALEGAIVIQSDGARVRVASPSEP